jgi:hypothetical protein
MASIEATTWLALSRHQAIELDDMVLNDTAVSVTDIDIVSRADGEVGDLGRL